MSLIAFLLLMPLMTQDDLTQKIKNLSIESDLLFSEQKWEACVLKRREALELARQSGDKWYQAVLSNNLGNACTRWDKYDEAEDAYREALRLALPEKDFHRVVHQTFDNIDGLAAAVSKDDPIKGADLYARLITGLDPLLPYPIKRDMRIRHASARLASQQSDKAAEIFDELIALDTTEGYSYGVAEMTFGKADARLRAKQWPQAATDFERIVKASSDLGDRMLEAWANERLAEVHIHQNDLATSERHLRRATELFETIQNPAGLARCYQVWVKVSEHRKAKDDVKKYTDLLAKARAMAEPARAPVILDADTFKKSLADLPDTAPILEIENSGTQLVFNNILDPKPQPVWKTGLDDARQPFSYAGYEFSLTGRKVTLNGRTWFVDKGKSLIVLKYGDLLLSR